MDISFIINIALELRKHGEVPVCPSFTKRSIRIKICPKKWKRFNRGGGGVSIKNQKVNNSKCGLFIRGGEAIFCQAQPKPQFNWG